jgi:hypothetical protein
VLLNQLQRIGTVFRFADDLDFRMGAQEPPKLSSRKTFVVDNERSHEF